MTAGQNIAYGAADANAAAEMADRFGVSALLGRRAPSLSGGERQLVALARALARRPRVLLLDEPFAALDQRTRSAARRALRALHSELGITLLHVTHDFGEAGMLGDMVVIMDCGRVLQSGPPEVVFRRPANAYVADFLGAENVLAGSVSDVTSPAGAGEASGAATFETGGLRMSVAGDVHRAATHAVIRAEDLSLSRDPTPNSMRNQFRGRVTEVLRSGALARVTVDVGGVPLVAAITTGSLEELDIAEGSDVVAAFKATAVHLC
jgi:molybdopterin-binding protein